VTFPPGRAGAVRSFYAGVLGLEEMPVPAEVADRGWVWFSTRDAGIELHFIPDELAPDPARSHHFCLEVEDLGAARVRLEEAGATVTAPQARILGRDRLFTRDPFGNLVELVEIAG
jgi:catechol 2,3-dioxygenase-like lactoylglutathione lyase family enzyme